MSEDLLTHKDLAKLLGVSETTIKSYRRKFPDCIPVANNGKPIRFTQQAAKVALKIKDLFSTGMSVEEVRLRLSQEFSWISPETKKIAKVKNTSEVPPEISTGVSSMAKSMVLMSQQQKSILGRMQAIEGMLEDFGINVDFDDLEEKRKKQKMLELEKQARIEQRLDALDNTTQNLMSAVGSMVKQMEVFFTSRAKAKEEWQKNQVENSASTPSVNEAHNKNVEQNIREVKIIPLYGKTPQEFVCPQEEREVEAEPPRSFFNLPLVIKNTQGHYVGAWGRSRGRFSLNDLKAMLVYGFTPPNHYVFIWKKHGQGWWLELFQPENPENLSIELLLLQVSAQRDESVVDILQIKRSGEKIHPAEISSILDNLVS